MNANDLQALLAICLIGLAFAGFMALVVGLFAARIFLVTRVFSALTSPRRHRRRERRRGREHAGRQGRE
jgi:hypothetical protein